MQWQYSPYVLPLVVSAAVSAGLSVYAWRRRHAAGAVPFTLLMAAVAEWSLVYALELGSVDFSVKLFWAKVQYPGIVSVPVMWLAFVLQYTGREKWLTRRNQLLLAAIPAFTLLVAWTDHLHHLLYASIRLDTSGPFTILDLTFGPGFWLNAAYAYVLLFLGTLLLVQAVVHSPRLYRGQISALLIGAFAPWVGNVFYILGRSPFPHLDLTPLAFTLTGLMVAWGLFRLQFLDIVPVARATVIENMDDGVIVLDDQDRIVDLNRAAERILDRPVSEIVGQIADQVLPGWLDPASNKGHREIAFYEGEARCYYDLLVSPLYDRRDRLTGRVAVLHDITTRKRAVEELRESEERYRLVFETAPLGILSADAEGNILAVNPAILKMLGSPSAEATRRINLLTFPLLKNAGVSADFRRCLELGIDVASEHLYTSKWGKETFFKFYLTPIKDLDSRVIGVHAILVDITERVRSEEERERLLVQIQEQAQRVQQIMDTVPEGVLLLDAELRLLVANPAAGRHLTVLADAQVGDSLTCLGGSPLEELLGPPPAGLWHNVTVDGPPVRLFEVIAQPMEAESEIQGWVMVTRDITQEREIQDRMQRQGQLAAVGQLAAGIAHDFNNIMAVIVLYSQMLLRGSDLPAGARERVATMENQAKLATGLIQQILDFSRRSILERRPMGLVPFLREQIAMLKRILPENIQIKLTSGPGEFLVNADPTRMQQAVMNLAVNARDAMPEGGTLAIDLERIGIENRERTPLPEMETGEWVRLTVSDSGVGIAADVLPHVFEPFFTTRAPLGSGLGLAQVYGIVKQHEGHIDVTTKLGKGTTFILYLPALTSSEPKAATEEAEALPTGRGEVILVVEDNEAVRKALVAGLEELNYHALEASNGRDALDLFDRHRHEIALVLSDLVMPEMGGMPLAHALRQQDATIKIIMMTGHPLQTRPTTLEETNVTAWLQKPPDLEQLARVIAQNLKK